MLKNSICFQNTYGSREQEPTLIDCLFLEKLSVINYEELDAASIIST